jgi:hypothetical protein
MAPLWDHPSYIPSFFIIIPAKPGQLERYDCEYRRNGTVNLFTTEKAREKLRKAYPVKES